MSKKFFSLIHGQDVHIAPKTKIIPSAAFSKLQSAQEVLKKVKKDAELYKKEVVAEIEALKEQAQRDGFAAGFKKWAEAIASLETEVRQVHEEMEKKIIPIALTAAKKIVNRELETAPQAIVDIVSANLKAVSTHKKITIYVNKKDLDTMESSRPQLKQLFESLESLSIRERADVTPGGCMIETERGIINAQLENRWRILETAFANLMKAKKDV